MNPTTDPKLRSFVPVAPQSHFPIQNLPYGVCLRDGERHIVAAIGDYVFDLTVLEELTLLDAPSLSERRVFDAGTLNAFMASGRTAWSEVRAAVSRLLSADVPLLTAWQ